jgi:type II secretory pathway pseudopilin PulG
MRNVPTGQQARRMAGSSLVEVALLLTVTAALTGLALRAYDTYGQRQSEDKTDNVLWTADTAVRDYVLRHGRAPCPDMNGDGAEDANKDNCNMAAGRLPFATLKMDAGSMPANARIWYTVFPPISQKPVEKEWAPEAQAPLVLLTGRVHKEFKSGSVAGPYMPVVTTNDGLRDCGSPRRMQVAYALVWDSRDVPQNPGNCLHDSPDRQVRVHAVGLHEFLGWIFQVAVQ